MMTEPAEHAKRSKLNMVIRLFACHCSLWSLKQAELKYQTRGEIACNSYDGGMSLKHVQDISFCGFFPIFYHSSLVSLPVFWDILVLWRVAHTSPAPCAGDCHVEMSPCGNVTMSLLLPTGGRSKQLIAHLWTRGLCSTTTGANHLELCFVSHWNNCGMVREVTPSSSVLFPL